MTFLAPALLALGLAAAVPLALHLLQRHPGPKLVFPALRYLRRAEREHATRLRLRQLLLLAARVMALLLLAAAAAQPFLATGGADHHPTSVVIILDNSMSAGAVVEDRRVLDHLKEVALRTLAVAAPEDRIWLIRAGQPWEAAMTGSPETLATAVRATEPAAAGALIPAQVARARSVLAAEPEGRAREIHLLSDLRSTAFRGEVGAGTEATLVVLEPPASAAANRAITAVEVGGGLPPRAGQRSTVAVAVTSFGRADPAPGAGDSVDVRLVMDGALRAAASTQPGEVAILPFPAGTAGTVTGRVEVDGDALAADDRRHFAVVVRSPPTVALRAPAPFVEEALAVLEEDGRLRRSASEPAEVVIAPGAVGADAVRRGGAVVVLPPESPLERTAANQRLADAGIPWRLARLREEESRLEVEGTGVEGLLADVRLRQVYELAPVAGATDTVLVRTRTGAAWAVAGATGSGRYLLLATPLTPEGGTISTSAAMLPLVERAVNVWVAGTSERAEHRPGDVVTLPPADSILRPDGRAEPVEAGSLYRLTDAGVYRLLEDGVTVTAFAVNSPPEASEVSVTTPRSAASMLSDGAARTATARAWESEIFRQRRGRDLTLPLLALAILVLVAEAGMAATWRRTIRESPVATPAAAAGAR